MEKAHKTSFILRFLIIAIAVISLICILLAMHERRTPTIVLDGMTDVSGSEKAVIEECSYDSGVLTVRGNCTIDDNETVPAFYRVLLREPEAGTATAIPTSTGIREDVVERYGDMFDLSDPDFTAVYHDKHKNLPNRTYEIWLLYDNGTDRYLINTNRQLMDLKVYGE